MEVLNEVGEYPIANRYVLPDQITVLLRRIIRGSEVRYRDLSPYLHWFEKHIQFVYVHVHEIQTRSSQHVHSILYSDTNMVHLPRRVMPGGQVTHTHTWCTQHVHSILTVTKIRT